LGMVYCQCEQGTLPRGANLGPTSLSLDKESLELLNVLVGVFTMPLVSPPFWSFSIFTSVCHLYSPLTCYTFLSSNCMSWDSTCVSYYAAGYYWYFSALCTQFVMYIPLWSWVNPQPVINLVFWALSSLRLWVSLWLVYQFCAHLRVWKFRPMDWK
jgi:hypothetical protein